MGVALRVLLSALLCQVVLDALGNPQRHIRCSAGFACRHAFAFDQESNFVIHGVITNIARSMAPTGAAATEVCQAADCDYLCIKEDDG